MQVRFSGCGERFAGIGEGGVVATWRLDAPRYVASDTGPLGRADWACQVCLIFALSSGGGCASCAAGLQFYLCNHLFIYLYILNMRSAMWSLTQALSAELTGPARFAPETWQS